MSELIDKFKTICEKYEIREKFRQNWSLDNSLLNLVFGMEYEETWNTINEIRSWVKTQNNPKYEEMIDYFMDIAQEIDWSNDWDF